MIKIENCEVMGWEHAIRGMRNPMNSWEKSDSGFVDNWNDSPNRLLIDVSEKYFFSIGPNDQDLMKRLRNAGTDHRKFMRMITVYLDITAPLYWWKEFDTYKVSTVANSCSTMHKIHAEEFTLDDFSCEHLIRTLKPDTHEAVYSLGIRDKYNDEITALPIRGLGIIIGLLNSNRNAYLAADEKLKRTDLTDTERKYVTTQRKLFWWQMIQLLPSSYNQKRTIMLNYEVLANMYTSRKNHKLDEWRELCKWMEGLPYSELITGNFGDAENSNGEFKEEE